MKLKDFDTWARNFLDFQEMESIDNALNGIQVGNDNTQITKMAFAVDACLDSFKRTKAENAQVLFVHHGLYWGSVLPLTGGRFERFSYLIKNNLSLYACHLPLDRHHELGNNAGMANSLGLIDVLPFGSLKGKNIGYRGRLPEPQNLEQIILTLFGHWDENINILQFGSKIIKTVGIISGGATREVSQAIEEKLDLYITGDASHTVYHECREAGINVMFAGHYLTEIFGVRAMAHHVHKHLGLDTVFIDIPTGY